VIKTSEAPETSPYIQNVQLNGHAYQRNWISFRDIAAGRTLHVALGSANRFWSAAAEDAQP